MYDCDFLYKFSTWYIIINYISEFALQVYINKRPHTSWKNLHRFVKYLKSKF